MNAHAAMSAYQKPKARPNESPASGAANTSRFFGHCLGRVLCATAFSHLSEPDSRAGAPCCGSVSLAAGVRNVISGPSTAGCPVESCLPKLSSREDGREVSVGDVVVPVGWLE